MNLLLLCIKIFLVRILDVSLGTVRTIVTIKGNNLLAALIGFFEVLVWFLIVAEAMNTAGSSIFIAISYAGGFASGTYIGGVLSNKIINTTLTVQIISNMADILYEELKKRNYGVTILDIETKEKSNKKMLILEINDKKLPDIRSITRNIDNKAFVFVNETKYVFNGYLGN